MTWRCVLLAVLLMGMAVALSAQSVNITEFPTPTSASSPRGIVAGPDGALWFTEIDAKKIGRITTGGTITEFSLPPSTAGPYPEGITAGPDGALWFTLSSAAMIGKITTAGGITLFPLPSGSAS